MNDLTGKFLPFQESEEIFAEGGGIDMKWTEPVRQGRVEDVCGAEQMYINWNGRTSAWKGNNKIRRGFD